MPPRDRLPGIFVEPVPPAERDALPRMDIAAFAGFAERGPCNRAIAIDSVAAFEACFGSEAVLARRAEDGRWSCAALPATVRAFFANGGQRCWVVRLARTPETESAWAKVAGRALDNHGVAEAGLFPLSGVLWRVPGPGGGPSRVRAARLQASSFGSWSDSMRIAVRLRARNLRLDGASAMPGGFRIVDPGNLDPGTLIELVARDGAMRRFAKVMRRDGTDLLLLWCASFLRTSASRDLDAEPGRIRKPGVNHVFDGTLFEGEDTRIEFAAETPKGVSPGDWLRFVAQGEAVWMLVERVGKAEVHGPAWQQVGSRLPVGEFWARTLKIDLASIDDGERRVFEGFEPGMAGSGLLDDDQFYAAARSRMAVERAPFCLSAGDRDTFDAAYASAQGRDFATLAALYGTPAFTPAARRALRSAWLPLGLTTDFGQACGAFPATRPALERDGLSRFDVELFLDPVLAASDTAGMASAIERRRDVEEFALTGIHALADTPGTAFGLPSLIAVPDVLQPGWVRAPAAGFPGIPDPGGMARHDWLTHAGGCLPEQAKDGLPSSPRVDRFLDCGTRKLETPGLRRASGRAGSGNFTLGFSTAQAGAIFILEESADSAFLDATEIYRGSNPEFAVSDRPEGAYYFRLRIESGGNSSDWAAIHLRVRVSEYVAGAGVSELLRQVHVATLRLSAGTAEMFALLGLPQDWRADAAARFGKQLRDLAPGYGGSAQLGRNEARALSYGALFHPWLVYRTDRRLRSKDSGLAAAPPLGCVAGVMAATARQHGAWIAHANHALIDVIGVAPALKDGVQRPLYDERVNVVRHMPLGFMLQDNDTLSDEPEWKEITVRRLMILLRRIALEQGNTYVFEPNGPVMRRAVENHFGRLLDDLQRRGAFAGANSRQSFILQVASRPGDADRGIFTVEIGVAPSVPMRFLNLRLSQQGGRLTLAEEAA